MLEAILRYGRRGIWKSAASPRLELPEAQAGGPLVTDLLLVAGGLALVLSRCPPAERQSRFPNADELYELLRVELKRHATTSASADLMQYTLREVSERLDPVSRGALRACLGRRTQADRLLRRPAFVIPPSDHRPDEPHPRVDARPD